MQRAQHAAATRALARKHKTCATPHTTPHTTPPHTSPRTSVYPPTHLHRLSGRPVEVWLERKEDHSVEKRSSDYGGETGVEKRSSDYGGETAGRRTFGESRHIAAAISRMYLAASAAFGCLMLCLGVLAVLQDAARWYPSRTFLNLRNISRYTRTNYTGTQISHVISLLDLHDRRPSRSPSSPRPSRPSPQHQPQVSQYLYLVYSLYW